MKQALRLFHTVRHLSTKQIAYHLYYRWRRLSVPPLSTSVQARVWVNAWRSPQWQSSCMDAAGQFQFLNESGRVDSSNDWNNPSKSKLWLYNLHYLDELNTIDADNRVLAINKLIDHWINDNPAPHGNGWEPYPLSLRLVNLIKWQMRQHYSGCRLLNSIQQQAIALSKQVEYHIMANHLFANGKALIFSGAALADGDKLLQQGLDILDAEIPEQFLTDGGHFELSPMYHAILLWDMCDLLNLSHTTGIAELQSRAADWRKVIERGLVWLAHMTHPDGEIAFFNDSTFGIAPRYTDLCQYTSVLGVTCPTKTQASLTHLAESGYITIKSNTEKLIIDVGEVGASYQPGHAHADTLSFELNLSGKRVFVNSGISQYGIGTERSFQRSTQAHNTVVVDGKNSSDVWGGFRVGKRAYPRNLQIEQSDEKIMVRCAHNGYNTTLNALTHLRQWEITKKHCRITDTVSSNYQLAKAYYYLHPDITLQRKSYNQLQLNDIDGKIVVLEFTNYATIDIQNMHWYPGFNLKKNNNCLVVTLTHNPLIFDINWYA